MSLQGMGNQEVIDRHMRDSMMKNAGANLMAVDAFKKANPDINVTVNIDVDGTLRQFKFEKE